MKSKIIPGFQVPFAERIKKEANIDTMAVGAIIDFNQAEDIIFKDRANLVAIGRELLADTQWVYKAASFFDLPNAKDFLPESYSFYLSRRDEYLDRQAKPYWLSVIRIDKIVKIYWNNKFIFLWF